MRFCWLVLWLLAACAFAPGVSWAACPEIPAVSRTPTAGSPFATGNKGVTTLDTQTSDNVRITGGCIDVPNLQTGGVSLRTPATCDAFSATNGVTAGTTFTSATASFTAADVGKPISIAGAGPTQFFNSTTIATAGTGHRPNEEIVLSGGTGTATTVVVRTTKVVSATVAAGGSGGTDGTQTVIGTTGTSPTTSPVRFQASVTVAGGTITAVLSITVAGQYAINPTVLAAEPVTGADLVGAQLNIEMGVRDVAGKAGDLGSYTAVPSNPVTAGDTGLTVTWYRDNLVTTIAGVQDEHTITLATAASVDTTSLRFAYGTDYSAQISAALSASKGVTLPYGKCGVASTINVDSFQALRAQGIGGSQQASTMLVWLGAVGGTMIKEDNGAAVNGTTIGPMGLDGNCSASTGLHLKGPQWGDFNAIAYNVKDYGWNFNMGDDGIADNYDNKYTPVAALLQPCSRNATGMYFGSANGVHDTNGNIFYFPQVLHQDGNGIDIVEGGFTNFYWTQIFRPSPGIGYSIFLHGSDDHQNKIAKTIVFHGLLSQGPVFAQSGAFPSNRNWIHMLNRQPFTTQVVIESGARLYCVATNGNHDFCTPYVATVNEPANPTGTSDTADYHMMGLAGAFTPRYSGKIHLTIQGNINNNKAGGGGGVLAVIRYGTGTPPGNGDAITGTGCGSVAILQSSPSGTFVQPVTLVCDFHGATTDTDWWYDVALKSDVSDTASIAQVVMGAHEWP